MTICGGTAAIVGAGPAGCAAALTLSRAGIETVVFERGSRSKDKPCGDAFLPSAVTLLRSHGIGPETLAELEGVPFDGVELKSERAVVWETRYGGETGWVVPRVRIDQALRDRVARPSVVRYGVKVVDVRPEHRGPIVVRFATDREASELCFDAVVLAMGSASPFARRLGIDGNPGLAASVSAYGRYDSAGGLSFRFSERHRPGYAWIFPTGQGRANVGVCALATRTAKTLRPGTKEFIKGLGATQVGRMRGGAEKIWSGRGTTWHHASGVVSCGDAGGLVDPLSGEGITAALLSGRRAGEAVAAFVGGNGSPAPLEIYSRWVAQHFGREYRDEGPRAVLAALCGYDPARP